MTPLGSHVYDLILKCIEGKSADSAKRYIKERQVDMLLLHYGFETNSHKTFEEIAKIYNLSRERIRQLHQKSLTRLKSVGKREEHSPPSKLIRILKREIQLMNGEDDFLKMINFCNLNLIGLSTEHSLKFISYFYLDSSKISDEIVKQYKYHQRSVEDEIWRKECLLFNEEQKRRKILERQTKVFSKIIWFDKKTKWNLDREFQPIRKVNKDSRYVSGEIYSEKCNRSIQFESSVEKNFIWFLEESPGVTCYLDQPVTLRHTTETGRTIQYTPDFVFFLPDKTGVLVETKILTEMCLSKVQKKLQILIDYCKEHGFGILLTDGYRTLTELIQRNYDKGLEKIFLDRLSEKSNRIMFYKEFKQIKEETGFKMLDFASIVILNHLDYYIQPFRLTNRNSNSVFYQYFVD